MKHTDSSFRIGMQGRLGAAFTLIALAGAAAHAGTLVNIETIALTGTDGVKGPGLGPGVVFTQLYGLASANDTPLIENSGRVSFAGFTSTVHGVWRSTGSGNDRWPTNGIAGLDPAVEADQFYGFETAGDRILFHVKLDGPGVDSTNDSTLLAAGDGEPLHVVVREGDPVPAGPPAGVFSVLTGGPSLRMSSDGRVVFDLNGPPGVRGVWLDEGGPIELVLRLNEPVPGMPPGSDITFLNTGDINASGVIAIRASVSGVGGAVLKGNVTDGFEVALNETDQAPTVGPGITFDLVGDEYLINEAGDIGFSCWLQGPVNNTNKYVVGSTRSGSVELITRSGRQAADQPEGVEYRVTQILGQDEEGGVLFRCGLTDTDGATSVASALYRSPAPDLINLIAKTGEQAPGADPGVTLRNLGFDEDDVSYNGNGLVAFIHDLVGPGVGDGNDVAIFLAGPSIALTKLLREGDTLEVAPGDVRTVRTLRFNSNCLNDSNQIAFNVTFTDGSGGVFRAGFGVDGDVNGDCIVDTADLGVLIGTFGQMGAGLAADLNGDNVVDTADLGLMLGAFGDSCG